MRINPPDIAERFDGSHHPKYAELREFQYSYSSVSSVVHHLFGEFVQQSHLLWSRRNQIHHG